MITDHKTWLQDRFKAVCTAIAQKYEHQQPIPITWVEEYNWLIELLIEPIAEPDTEPVAERSRSGRSVEVTNAVIPDNDPTNQYS